MSTAELKFSLHQLIDGIKDPSLLKSIYTLVSKATENKGDWADELPPHVIDQLLKSIEQADRGETIPHDVVMAKMKIRYPHLNL